MSADLGAGGRQAVSQTETQAGNGLTETMLPPTVSTCQSPFPAEHTGLCVKGRLPGHSGALEPAP